MHVIFRIIQLQANELPAVKMKFMQHLGLPLRTGPVQTLKKHYYIIYSTSIILALMT
jgi:hypothetical protein